MDLIATDSSPLGSTRTKKEGPPPQGAWREGGQVDEIVWASSINGDERCQGQRVDMDGHPVDRVME